jgi:hypothetical protein
MTQNLNLEANIKLSLLKTEFKELNSERGYVHY